MQSSCTGPEGPRQKLCASCGTSGINRVFDWGCRRPALVTTEKKMNECINTSLLDYIHQYRETKKFLTKTDVCVFGFGWGPSHSLQVGAPRVHNKTLRE